MSILVTIKTENMYSIEHEHKCFMYTSNLKKIFKLFIQLYYKYLLVLFTCKYLNPLKGMHQYLERYLSTYKNTLFTVYMLV